MAMRLSGLASNMDTDSMVKELVKASSAKKIKMEKSQTKLGWKQTAWNNLNTKVVNFFKTSLDNMRSRGSYNKKKTTVADSTVASVVASADAPNGSQTLQVVALAKSGSLTGGKLSNDKRYKKATTMETLGAVASGDTAKIKVNTGGKETVIELTSGMTLGNLADKLNAAGVVANFDETNQRFFITSKNSGKSGDFTLTAENGEGLSALSDLGLLSKADIDNNPEYGVWAAFKGIDDQATAANLTNAGKISDEVAARVTKLKANNESLKKSNEDIKAVRDDLIQKHHAYIATGEFRDAMNAVDSSGLGTVDDNVLSLDLSIQNIKTEMNRFKELDVKKATDAGLTADEQLEYDALGQRGLDGAWDTLPEDEKNLAILKKAQKYDTDIAAQQAKMDANDVKISANNDRIGSTTDTDGNILPGTGNGTQLLTDEVTADLVEKVNTAADAIASAGSMTSTPGDDTKPTRVMGKDAAITLNGAAFTSSSNTFSVNGLTITAMSETGPQTTINTSVDTEGIYNQIRDFIKEYNKLINEMDSLYNAASSKGYEPLTSEEKDALSDTEVKEWEAKIKDSLLKRDSDLSSVTSMMKTNMMGSIEVNGKKISLLTYGIETQSYFNAANNEKSAYHITGDPDDTVKLNDNKDLLKKAIVNNPDEVAEFFSKFTTKMYDDLNEEMKFVKDYRSTFHIYDDKKMASDYKDYTDKIKAQEKKLKALEDRYYKQFTAMEKAMSKLNSTQSSLSSIFGAG